MADSKLIQTIRHNCDISDARDNGMYSICVLVLKLRNLYKWEHGIEPWQEPESKDLLGWIDAKEKYWKTIAKEPYLPLDVRGREEDPFALSVTNSLLAEDGLVYGAGYGRSLKSIFFLAEKIRDESVEGCPVVILGREMARELSSPFAMLQDGIIIIRRDPMRFFFWDHIQEMRSSSRASLHHALDRYGIFTDGQLDHVAFRRQLDTIVDEEIPIFIHHEVGEMRQHTFDSNTLRKIISTFPDTVIEYVSRAVKDVLADTHPDGMVSFIIRERRDASLGFFVGFLAGLRRILSPEIITAFDPFLQERDWGLIEQARIAGREKSLGLAEKIRAIADLIDVEDKEQIALRFSTEILAPLGLEPPAPGK